MSIIQRPRLGASFFAWTAAVHCMVGVPKAHATDRFYPDQTVRSSDGRVRVETKSPDNAKAVGGRLVPFAKDFTYVLYDEQSGRAVWTRKQPKNEGSPVSIYVSDDRWVVVRDATDSLLILEPQKGEKVLSVDLLKRFPERERRRYVHWTTAGLQWSGLSYWRFFTLQGRLHFVVRTWWGRRVIVDLNAAKVVPVRHPMREELDEIETAFVLETLEAVAKMAPPTGDQCAEDVPDEVYTAAYISGRRGIKAASLFLGKLETWEVRWSTTFGGWGCDVRGGEINPFEYADFRLRQIAQLSLRRLGEKPECYAATRFRFHEEGPNLGEIVNVRSPFSERGSKTDGVKTDMRPLAVLREIGAPDYVGYRSHITQRRGASSRSVWEYDIDGDAPYTLQIEWDPDKAVVLSVKKIEPPLWQEGETRDEDLVW